MTSNLTTQTGFLWRWKFSILLVLLMFLGASSALAQEAVLELDPAQTQVNFTLGATLHNVHGTFKLKHGTVKFDIASGRASGMVVVDATSGDTDNNSRDHKMHQDVLESARYPEITFVPQQVQGKVLPQGNFEVQVSGIFTLHGTGHPLTLNVQAHVAGGHLTADANFTVPYQSWGLKNPSNLFLRVNDSVDIAIHAAGALKLASAAP